MLREDGKMNDKVEMKGVLRGIKAAFPSTLPIFFGWIFVALTYGVLMEQLGYSAERKDAEGIL